MKNIITILNELDNNKYEVDYNFGEDMQFIKIVDFTELRHDILDARELKATIKNYTGNRIEIPYVDIEKDEDEYIINLAKYVLRTYNETYNESELDYIEVETFTRKTEKGAINQAVKTGAYWNGLIN